jgi:N-acetylneuraminate synthase
MVSPTVEIAGKKIGKDHLPVLVGEIGINANGDRSIAIQLMEKVQYRDWDFVKFQKRSLAEDGAGCYKKEYLDLPRESPWGNTQREQKTALEFSREDYQYFDVVSSEIGVPWYASPWDVASVDFLSEFDPPAYKIASPILTNTELIDAIISQDKPVVVSTGLSTEVLLDSVLAKCIDKVPTIILHCVSLYPCSPHVMDLRRIKSLEQDYPTCPIGYSGHEEGILASIVAWSLGACMIERHITIDRNMYGSDQKAAIEGIDMAVLRDFTKHYPREDVEAMLGSGFRGRKSLPLKEREVFNKFLESMEGLQDMT